MKIILALLLALPAFMLIRLFGPIQEPPQAEVPCVDGWFYNRTHDLFTFCDEGQRLVVADGKGNLMLWRKKQ